MNTNKCNCLCHFKKTPTKEEYAVSSYYGCSHCRKPTNKWIEEEQIRILSKAPRGLIEIVGKHSTFWNYSKLETIHKLTDLIKKVQEEERKKIASMIDNPDDLGDNVAFYLRLKEITNKTKGE